VWWKVRTWRLKWLRRGVEMGICPNVEKRKDCVTFWHVQERRNGRKRLWIRGFGIFDPVIAQ
jgi:hypothetical protein